MWSTFFQANVQAVIFGGKKFGKEGNWAYFCGHLNYDYVTCKAISSSWQQSSNAKTTGWTARKAAPLAFNQQGPDVHWYLVILKDYILYQRASSIAQSTGVKLPGHRNHQRKRKHDESKLNRQCCANILLYASQQKCPLSIICPSLWWSKCSLWRMPFTLRNSSNTLSSDIYRVEQPKATVAKTFMLGKKMSKTVLNGGWW